MWTNHFLPTFSPIYLFFLFFLFFFFQVLLEFYDPDTASTSQWWFCYDILHIPDDFVKTSLQVIHEAQQLPQLVELGKNEKKKERREEMRKRIEKITNKQKIKP